MKNKPKEIKKINVKKLREFLNKVPDDYQLSCGCGTKLTNAEVEDDDDNYEDCKQVLLWGKG